MPSPVESVQALRGIDDAVLAMERNGFFIDTDFCDRTARVAAQDEAETWEGLRSWVASAGMDVTDVFGTPLLMRTGDERVGESGQKLQELLHGRFGLPPSPFWKKGRVKDGEVKTDAAAIEYLSGHHPEHRAALTSVLGLRRARGCLKYLRKLPLFVSRHDGRVHPVYGPSSDDDGRVGAISGRFALKKPEGQQMPRDPRKDRYGIRRAFIPQRPGHVILGSDQTALEVVVSAHVQNRLFGLTDMVEAVMPGAPDIHSVHALGVFRDVLGHTYLEGVTPATLKKHPDPRVTSCRELIKAVFYGLAYGKEEYGFGNTLFDFEGNSLGEERAREMLHGLFTLRPGIPMYKDWVRGFITEHRGIPSLSGRWCDLGELLAKAEEELRRSHRFTELWETWAFKKAWRRALNFPMQAGAADIMGAALIAVHTDPTLRAMGFFPILQVHDEILLEGPEENAEEASERFRNLMTGAWPTLRAPLQATSKWGGSWYECK